MKHRPGLRLRTRRRRLGEAERRRALASSPSESPPNAHGRRSIDDGMEDGSKCPSHLTRCAASSQISPSLKINLRLDKNKNFVI